MAQITLFLTIVSIQLHSRGWILPFSEAANCLPPPPLWTTYCRCSGNNCLFNYFKEIGPVETEPMQAAGQTNVRRIRKPGPPCWKLTDVRAIAFCFLVKTNAADPRSVLIDLKQFYHPSHRKCCIVARTRSLSLNIHVAHYTTGNPGSVIVPQYGSSKITVFVWGKNIILKFLGNTK